MSESSGQDRLAVLIDADNAQPATLEPLMAEVAHYGVATVKRIYGDWTRPDLGGWKKLLLDYSIQPVQQFAYTRGKNATDSALIIDAMDLLYTKELEGFCIVSSDSDFTRLASRLRESGKAVLGFGEKKTPKPFVAACDKFLYTEVLLAEESDSGGGQPSARELRQDADLVKLLRNTVDSLADDDGWAYLGAIGTSLAKIAPDFDSRNYGRKKLSDLLRATGLFEEERRERKGSSGKEIFVRFKKKKR